MSRLARWIPVLSAGAVLAGCVGVQVRTDQDTRLLTSVHCQSVEWAGGFKGASPLRNTIANPLNEGRLRDAIAANLQSAGITLVDVPPSTAGNHSVASGPAPAAQCLIGYGIGMERQIDSVYPEGWGYGPSFWGPGWAGPGWGWGTPYIYHQSFITVDVYDAASKKPMWHASAEQSLSGLSGDAANQRIRAAVDAIFLKFPR